MKRDNLFWGSALILVGILFFLQTQGIVASIFPYLWPIALILFGAWLILGVYWKPNLADEDHFEVALQGAKSVRYQFSYGAGKVNIRGGAADGKAMTGSTGIGIEEKNDLDGDRLNVKIEAGPSFLPFFGPSNGSWNFQLTKEVPVNIKIETGASSLDMDLSDVQARQIELETGASSSNIIMPASGVSTLELEAGAASINITIPSGVAGRIRLKEGLTSLYVDKTRFPQLDSRLYQSPDFDTAANRAEINVEAGLGSISIK